MDQKSSKHKRSSSKGTKRGEMDAVSLGTKSTTEELLVESQEAMRRGLTAAADVHKPVQRQPGEDTDEEGDVKRTPTLTASELKPSITFRDQEPTGTRRPDDTVEPWPLRYGAG